MSTPYSGGTDPQDPSTNHNLGNDAATPYGQNYGQGYESYEAYGTPEQGYGAYNQTSFDVNSADAGHGATRFHGTTLVDGTYGDGQMSHPVNDPVVNGWPHLKGTGKLNAVEAWGFGFKQTFANWKVWIVIGLLITVLPVGVSVLAPLMGSLVQFVMLFFTPFFYSFALLQTLSRHWKFDGLKAPGYGPTLGMIVLLGFIALGVFMALFFVATMLFGGSIVEVLETLDSVQIENDPEALLPVVGALLGMVGFIMLVSFFIMPFFTFPAWYAADRATSFGAALSEGMKAGVRNYGQMLLFYLISVLLAFASIITFGLAAIAISPAGILATCYAYRQVSGGPVPATQ